MTRLVFIILFFLASLLTVVDAPAYYLWLLAIGATEFPLIFGGITLALIVSGYWVKKFQMAGTIIGVLALLLFFSPVARAYWVGAQVKPDMVAAFGNGSIMPRFPKQHPFSFWRMFSTTKDLPYKTVDYVNYPGLSLSLDFYQSQIPGKKPCIVVVHGGSWNLGDSRQLPELNSYLARAGYNVASINYRMAPKYTNPAPVQDVDAALAYLHTHAEEFKIDTNNFVLLGRSAGAQIALLAAYTLHDKGIAGVVDFYGPADMVWGYSLPANPWVMDSRGVMEMYLGGTYKQVPENYVASSPVEFVDKRSVPTLIIHGGHDVLVAYDHSRRLSEKLQKNGIKNYWLKLPWATHGFDFNFTGPGGQLSTFAVETFLNTVTRK